MTRRGRPPSTDSADTRQRIISVARIEFATRGYGDTAIKAVASKAGLVPGSIYHYYGGKADLYEAVFEATSSTIWSSMGASLASYTTLAEAVDALISAARKTDGERPMYNAFLANVPTEARVHPEFAHLLDRRSKYQDELFGALAELGLATGELDGFDLAQATEVIRAPVMGWFFERHFRGAEVDHGGEAVCALFRALANRQPVTPRVI